MAKLNALLLEPRNGNINLSKYFSPRVRIEPTTSRFYSQILCPYATTDLNILISFQFIKIDYRLHAPEVPSNQTHNTNNLRLVFFFLFSNRVCASIHTSNNLPLYVFNDYN